jgi:hypothetical protein
MKVRTDMDTFMGLHSPARFRVEPDTARGVTYITLSGFFLLPDVAAFDREWAQAHRLLRCAPNAHLTLCDISDMSIQSQDVVNAFTTIVRDPVRQRIHLGDAQHPARPHGPMAGHRAGHGIQPLA